MYPIYFLIITLLILTLAHLAFAIKFGIEIPINLLFHKYNNEHNKSNIQTDLFKFLPSTLFLLAPLLIIKSYSSLHVENNYIDIVVLLILISLTVYLFYFNKYKIWNNAFKKIEKPKSLQDEFNAKTENTLDFHERAINDNHKKATSIGNDLNKTKKILKKETSDIFKVALDNQNNIENLKKKTEVKPRESERREEKVSAIEKACKLFMKDLESLPSYNKGEKTIDYKKHNLTELQANQTLVEYFKNNYKIPVHNTNAIIFNVFNVHFDIKERKLKSSNWNDFKNRLLPNIENNCLYSDLCLNIKK